jgi:hypothetical protein
MLNSSMGADGGQANALAVLRRSGLTHGGKE